LFPDMKKKKAVRKSIEDKFGRGGGGAMNTPGGMFGGGAKSWFAGVAGVEVGRGDCGPSCPGVLSKLDIVGKVECISNNNDNIDDATR
jgi:hypothetical protein